MDSICVFEDTGSGWNRTNKRGTGTGTGATNNRTGQQDREQQQEQQVKLKAKKFPLQEEDSTPHPFFKNQFCFSISFRVPNILPKQYGYLIILYICITKGIVMKMKYKSMGGLDVKNGRLVNDREPGVSGIERAARIKKSMCKARRVDEIADGIELAEGRKNFYRL